MYKINNIANYNIEPHEELLHDFLNFAIKRFNINKCFKVFLISDLKNSKKSLCSTGAYNPLTQTIYVYTDNRLFKDILRSVAHEVFHHSQYCHGEFDDTSKTQFGIGYAQKNKYMRNIERTAYEKGNLALRDFEDQKKKKK